MTKNLNLTTNKALILQPVTREDASGFGIMKVNSDSVITEFMEKPGPDKNIDDWKIPEKSLIKPDDPNKQYLA